MNNVTEIVTLLRQQAEIEFPILAGRADALAAEPRMGIDAPTAHRPETLRAVLETARALQRTPDAVSLRDVTAFGGAH